MATAVEEAINEKLESQSHTFVLSPTTTKACLSDYSPITVSDIDAHMMTAKAASPPLDIYVRTSGVTRFSDYLLWQVRILLTLSGFSMLNLFTFVWDLARHSS